MMLNNIFDLLITKRKGHFPIPHPIKMHATDAKMQKIEPDLNV